MKSSPVQVFPWQRNFLLDLKDFLWNVSEGRPGSVLLIAPNNRPWRYLTHLYAEDGYVGPLPHFLPLAKAISLWRRLITKTTLHMAEAMDRVALLYEIVLRLAKDDQRLAARFAHMDVSTFLPWGIRLARVYEEMLSQRITAVDIAHVEEEVAQPAADLLGGLGRIGKDYVDELNRHGWTTPGLDVFTVANDEGPIPHFFQPEPDRPVIMAGFAMLSGAEEALLHRLWQAGGFFCLHADPALAAGRGYHWACDFLSDTLRRWKAKAELAVSLNPGELEQQPRISFFAGYDCHSQLQALREELVSKAPSESLTTAVALVDNALLMPVLHHLPEKDVNISMGYPLERSPLNRLLEAVLKLCESRTEDGRYYWRNLLQCLHHPYLNMLEVKSEHGVDLPLRNGLRRLEKNVRRGPRFVDWDALMADCSSELPQEMVTMLEEICKRVLHAPCAAATLNDMADWILDLCDFLLSNGGDMWQHFPLDAEAMYRLVRHTAPSLRQNCLAHTPFPMSTRHSIVRQILQQERIPFEAEPLMGLQVLGMLETRLLHFDRIFILDATDDKIPGNPAQDPLLPETLRQVLGLPDARGRERVAAYALYRLCFGASEVLFFWQEGITRSSLFDGKKIRSRFVEQLIWQEERSRGELLIAGHPPFLSARCTIRPLPRYVARVDRASSLDSAMMSILTAPLSATRLDTYQQCPLRFAWQYLCRLNPLSEVNEKDDPAAVGICIHEALRMMFEPYLKKVVHRGDISRETMQACFEEALEKSGLRQVLPPDSCLMLEEAAPVRLWHFLQNQPESTCIVDLEKPLEAVLQLGGHDYSFTGIVDRLDMRNDLLYVLDYKTGSLKKFDPGLWEDVPFFQRIEEMCTRFVPNVSPTVADLELLQSIFEEMRLRLPSVQLPCYVCMAHAADLGSLGDAALVELRSDGKEYPLFGELSNDELPAARHYCTLSLCVIVLHMRYMPYFMALPGKQCEQCPYAGLCAV